MKKLVLILMVLSTQAIIAQKIAYIDTEKILDKMPEFAIASNEIDSIISLFEEEVNSKYQAVESLYQDYVNNEAIYNGEEKKQRQDEIYEAEKAAKEFREKKFGAEGELYQLQDSKIKPLQDKIKLASESIAKRKNYDYVFEKSIETSWIYLNPEHDITTDVMIELNLIK